jgi:hypothetical protein
VDPVRAGITSQIKNRSKRFEAVITSKLTSGVALRGQRLEAARTCLIKVRNFRINYYSAPKNIQRQILAIIVQFIIFYDRRHPHHSYFFYLYFMKGVFYLLSIYILALTAMPCRDKNCCMDELTQDQGSSHKPEAPCSPFFICNTCHGFIIPESNIALQEPMTITTKMTPTISNLRLSDFSSPTWQPPKNC